MSNETENQTGESQQTQNPASSQGSENLEERIEELNQSGNKSGKRKKIYLMIGIILLSGIVAGSYYFWDDLVNFLNPKGETGKIDCMMDTKECPDGSFVNRIQPNCEFAECPPVIDGKNTIDKVDTSDWQIYRNEEYGFEMKYPTGWKKASEKEKEQTTALLSVFDMPVLNRDFLGKASEEMVLIEIIVLDNLEKKSLSDFSLERMGGEDVVLIPRNSFSLNGVEAIQAGYNYEKMDMLEVLNMIEISSKEFVYIQLIADSNFKDDLDIFNKIIYSFKLFQDTDNDGLPNDKEAEYGCDINNPDSDGDGYLDGDEVENGYNPMGEGKL